MRAGRFRSGRIANPSAGSTISCRSPYSEETHRATILELAQKMLRGEAAPPPIGRLLGFVLKSIEPGWAVFEREVDERHHNPWATQHRGGPGRVTLAALAYSPRLGESVAAQRPQILGYGGWRPLRSPSVPARPLSQVARCGRGLP